MKKKLIIVLTVAVTSLCFSCATSEKFAKQTQSNKGTLFMSAKLDLPVMAEAVKYGFKRQNVAFEKEEKINSNATIILGTLKSSMNDWGQHIKVTIVKEGGTTNIYYYSKKRIEGNVSANLESLRNNIRIYMSHYIEYAKEGIDLYSQEIIAEKLSQKKNKIIDLEHEQIVLYATLVEKHKTPVKWQQVINRRECENIIPLPDGNLLYGLFYLDRGKESYSILFPNYGPLCKVDAENGNILWEYERSGVFGKTVYLILDISDNEILIRHHTEKNIHLISIDLATGKEIWKEELKSEAQCMMMHNGETLFVYAPTDDGWIMEGYSPALHKKCYSTSLKGVGKDGVAHLIGDNRIVVTDGNNFYLIDAATGMRLSHETFPSSLTECYVIYNAFILTSADGTTKLFGNDGNQIWESPATDYTPYLCTEAGKMLYWIKQINGNYSIVAVGTADGKIVWEQPLDGYMKSNFCFGNNKVALTTENKLWFFDMASGAVEKETDFNTGGNSQIDRITYDGDKWIVSTEENVACYNTAFDCLWQYDLKGFVVPISNHDFTKGIVETNKSVASNQSAQIPKPTLNAQNALRNYDHWNAEYGRNPNIVNRAQVGAAIDQVKYATQLEQSQAQMAAINSIKEVTNVILGLLADHWIKKENKERQEAQVIMEQWTYAMVNKENAMLRQGKYFIRRFETNRSVNLFVVDTENGKWAEVILGPRETQKMENILPFKFCLYTYQPEEETISTYGTGLDASKWETELLFFSVYAYAKYVKKSLLSFRIADMNFRNYSEYAANTIAR